jgi:acyl-CoA synthetase (AMP-forming)/AMP-acid ligase II
MLAGPPASEEPGIGALTLGGFFDEVTTRWSAREAISFDGRTLTYAELRDTTRALSRGLMARGVGKGMRVALLMGNRPEWIETVYAAAMTGAAVVPLNTYFEAPELEYVLRHCDATWLVGQPELAGHEYAQTLEKLDVTALTTVIWLGSEEWDALHEAGGATSDEMLDQRVASIAPDDDALVLYTSGTTARPKGVVHVHRAPTLQSWRFVRHLALDSDERTWSAYPFFWAAGFCMVMGATFAAGGCVVLQERFEPGAALQLLEAERVTTAYAWPHQLADLEQHPGWLSRDLSSIRHADVFSPFARHPSVRDLPDWSPRSAYGASETFTIVTSTAADTPGSQREGHHGAVLPGNVVRIVDGEITVKGPTMMRGYHGTAAQDCFDADGFFHTGDAGFIDDEGRLHWTGRLTDMIKTGGANVSPVEIETELLEHPLLKASVAIGVPHDTLGEMVVVAAMPQEGADIDEDGVRSFLRGRLASYKIPRRVLFFTDDDVELTGNSKIRTPELRALVMARLDDADR